jgi:serine/threonine protein kinase
MSVTFLDTGESSQELSGRGPATVDLDSTTDVHEEHTSDLAPVATEDVTPDVPLAGGVTLNESASVTNAARLQRSTTEEPAPEPRPPAREVPPATTPPRESIAGKPRTIALAPGAVLYDRYLIEQVIGRGGTAVVFRARDMHSSTSGAPNLQIAIKAPRAELNDRERAVVRLHHEFEHARRLSHPSIVRVFEFHAGPQCFIAMELIEGRLLSSLVRDWTMLAPPLTHKILRDCADALTHAHSRGVVHGDFKPGNVFVTADEQVKIVDFGAAATTPGSDECRIAAGTPAYASPEVLSGAAPEPRDDVFSFACVAYELLTGQHPFERCSSLRARDEGLIPPRAWSLSAKQWLTLLSAMSWERARRPADIATLMEALTTESAAIEATPLHAPPPAAAVELKAELMPRQSSWGFFVFVACALVVILIATRRPGTPEATPAKVTTTTPAPAATSPAPPQPLVTQDPDAAQVAAMPSAAGALPLAGKPAQSAPGSAAPARARASDPKPAAASTKGTKAIGSKATKAVGSGTSARPARAPMSQISFESPSVETTESSVAAVVVIKRSQPLSGRIRVQWSALSGTADAGIDFAANAKGTIEFADGQAQRAVYVPLRNDLLKEEDETFTVQLQSQQPGRLGAVSRATVKIRDDD